ncbi:glycosyltransferase family 2 protein [Thermodesulfobacteriota bacterium]
MTEKKAENISIILPVYNEELGIESVLNDIYTVIKDITYNCEVLIIDDGSTDNTLELAAKFPVSIYQHPNNLGYGAALKTGLAHANNDIICIVDADGTYPVKDIPKLVNTLIEKDMDMVVGARVNANAAIPAIRKPAKWVLGQLAKLSVGVKIPDINSGFRVFKRDAAINFINLLPNGFSFTTTITLAMLNNQYSVKYVPIDYYHRIGKSKISPFRDTTKFLLLITRIALYFAPLKVFLSMSFIMMLFALFWGIFSLLVLGKLADISTLVIFLSAIQIGAIGLIAEHINHRLSNEYHKARMRPLLKEKDK